MKMVSGYIRITSPHQEWGTEVLIRRFDDTWKLTYYREEVTTIEGEDYTIHTDDHYNLFIEDKKNDSVVACSRASFLNYARGKFRKGISSKDIPSIIEDLRRDERLVEGTEAEEWSEGRY